VSEPVPFPPADGLVAVIGAGTMGRGVALAAARRGMSVLLHDIDGTRLREVTAGLQQRLARDRKDGKSAEGGDVMPAEALETAARAADVVIEAVPEITDIKVPVLRDIHRVARQDAILASNTSTMSIGQLGESAGCADRLIGMHFFNPAEKMPLVEVIMTPATPAERLAECQEFVRLLAKTAIVVKDSPGFVTSRLGLILGNEAMRLLEEGVAAADAIDTAMRLGYNHPMGPLELADLVGLDARLNNLKALHAALGEERFRPPEVLVRMVGNRQLGRKSGQGFYRYDESGRRVG
jgi:3-hydroxybutyryl-CoA dehydrogenase